MFQLEQDCGMEGALNFPCTTACRSSLIYLLCRKNACVQLFCHLHNICSYFICNFCHDGRVLADGHISWACEAFSELHKQDLVLIPALLW